MSCHLLREAMANFVLSLFLGFVSAHFVRGAVDITADPSQVEIDLTHSLTVNCTFTYDNSSSDSTLVSLVLLATNDMQFPVKNEEIATVDAFNGLHIEQVTGQNTTVFGQIIPGGQAYIGVTFIDPTQFQTGFYRCDANLLDPTGHPSGLSNSVSVTPLEADVALLLDKVRAMENQLLALTNNLNAVNSSLTKEINYLRNDLQALIGVSNAPNSS